MAAEVRHREAIILPPRRVEINRAKYSAAIDTALGFHYFLTVTLFCAIFASAVGPYQLTDEECQRVHERRDFMYFWMLGICFFHCAYVMVITMVYSVGLHYNAKTPFQQRQLCRIDAVLLVYLAIYLLYTFLPLAEYTFTWSFGWCLCHGLAFLLSLDLCVYSFAERSILPLPEMTHGPLNFIRQRAEINQN